MSTSNQSGWTADDQYRDRLESLFAKRVSDDQWKILKRQVTFDRMISGEGSFNEWLQDCVEILSAFGFKLPKRVLSEQSDLKTEEGTDQASTEQIDWVISHLVAAKANEEHHEYLAPVRQGFAEYTEQEVIKELERLARLELLNSEPDSDRLAGLRDLVSAELSAAPEDAVVIDSSALHQALFMAAHRLISIQLPSDGGIYYIPVLKEGGSLARFNDVLQELASEYSWNPEEAAAFVLFGSVPFIPSSRAHWFPHARVPGLSRIVLVLDPYLSPDEVREIYRSENRKYTKYPRRISMKHLAAAWFAFAESPGFDWSETFKAHRQHFSAQPSLLFPNAKTFRRDAERAYNRLLLPEFDS